MKKISIFLLLALLIAFLFPSKSLATSWAYIFVVWDGYIYEVTDEYVTDIDKKIGQVTVYSDMESYTGNFSNAYERGTEYYSIKGINTNEAIAVEVSDGEYRKAIRRGEHVGEKTNPTQIIKILLAAGAIILVGLTVVAIKLSYNRKK
ncbi:hypothetical protein [Radiobacillus sp. PE A8.2]|uniref:hypothetical protein n=1 Tax=Radiobacillus sp. PE A8.2 TaxID=3380349 RepID=UPI0038910710